MKEIAAHIIELVRQNQQDKNSHVHFSKPYSVIPFNNDNFHQLKAISNKAMAFVDGGNAELLQSSQFSLQFIRVYGCVYSNGKKISGKRRQFYAYIRAEKKNGALTYCTKLFDCEFLNERDFCFEFNVDEQSKELSVSSIGQLIRRCAELSYARNLISSLESDSILLLDGSLQCSELIEKKYMDTLLEESQKKQITIGALSKTTGLMTDSGNSVASALSSFRIAGKWLYHPIAIIDDDSYKAELSFVKLHEKSKYIFKFEIDKDRKSHLKDAAQNLSSLGSDAVFLGYPYGLIDADMHARISKAEKQQLTLRFKVALGKDWSLIESSLNSANAHEILDKINYS